jgi:hypothetical protein
MCHRYLLYCCSLTLGYVKLPSDIICRYSILTLGYVKLPTVYTISGLFLAYFVYTGRKLLGISWSI